MILAKRLLCTFLKRYYSSALYITNDKAQKMCVLLTPVVDFEARLKEKSALELNLKVRRSNIDLDKLERRWNFYKHFDNQKIILETTRTVIAEKIKKLHEQNDSKNEEYIQQLNTHLILVKDDLHVLKDYLYGVEEDAVLKVLSLPNILNKNTPHEDEVIVYSYLERPITIAPSHIDAINLIEYTNEFYYFLKNEAACFELASVDYFTDCLLKSSYTQYNHSDFCRSVIVEGCGLDFSNKLEVFTLEEIHNDASNELNRLHLTGGASLFAFMAYFARNLVPESYFPLKLFTSGRKFQPVDCKNASLLNVNQETVVELLIATKDDDDALQKEFDELILIVRKMYEGLGQHFRLVYEPAHKLMKHESLRLSIQMFSNFLQKYIEVGNCSIYDSYLSKRLQFNYLDNKECKYPKIISGSLLRVQPLLACTLENNNLHSDLFNNVLKDFVLLK